VWWDNSFVKDAKRTLLDEAALMEYAARLLSGGAYAAVKCATSCGSGRHGWTMWTRREELMFGPKMAVGVKL
jgi:hypothetical protein